MIIADILGLKYAAAGVIAILSTQSTRRQSVEIAPANMFKPLGLNNSIYNILLLAIVQLPLASIC